MREKIFVTKAYLPAMEEYVKQLGRVWNNHILTNMGELHDEFEHQLAEYLRVPYCVTSNNGHMALEILLQALKLQGEVITTPFTFISTTHAIVRSGLIPVFADIKREDYTIDPDSVEQLITPKTCAIVPVHVYGNPCAVERLQEIAERYKLKVIYDAAHAFGVRYKGKEIGSYGHASMFSFHATKPFNSIEGGAVVSQDKTVCDEVRFLRNFGICEEEEEEAVIGTNAKLSEFHAAMGLCNLKHMEEITKGRRRVVERYCERLKTVKGLTFFMPNEDVESNYAYFPVVIEKDVFGESRDELCARLQAEDIFARKYFYPLTKDYSCYKSRFSQCKTPMAEYISKSILTLPLYADLRLNDVDRICDIICKGRE